MEIVWSIAGLVIGGLIGWVVGTSRLRANSESVTSGVKASLAASESTVAELRSAASEYGNVISELRQRLHKVDQSRVVAETRVQEGVKHVEEQKRLLLEAEKKFKDIFTLLSNEALERNSTKFIETAEERFKPLKEALHRYENQFKELETARLKDHGQLSQQLKQLGEREHELLKETHSLASALRRPQVKGRWGELQLRRVLELAGMTEHSDFTEQSSISVGSGSLRPDAVVHLPGDRTVVIDSKAPLKFFLDAMESPDEAARRRCMDEYAKSVRNHMKELSKKAYWSQFRQSPEFVFMFLPGEAFFSAALDCDRTLIEKGAEDRVILVSPTTIVGALLALAHSWQQQTMLENAREIGEAARELLDRVCTFYSHFDSVGKGLANASESFNRSVRSFQSRVLPSGRRISELSSPKGLPLPEPVEVAIGPLVANATEQPDDEVENPERPEEEVPATLPIVFE